MQTSYRYVNTNIQDAALNMALDEAILQHHIRGAVPPTLRVFRWSQPSIHWDVFRTSNVKLRASVACNKESPSCVVPRADGRSITATEFTYSIVIGKREGIPTGVVSRLCLSCTRTTGRTKRVGRAG